MVIFWSIFAPFSPDIQSNVTFLTEIISTGSNSLKKTDNSLATFGKKKENTKNWWNFLKIWDIKANLGKLITLITVKMYINKILFIIFHLFFYFMWICFVVFELWHFKVLVVKIIVKLVMYPFRICILCARLYKTPESGNGTQMSDEKWRSTNSRYLKNEKW